MIQDLVFFFVSLSTTLFIAAVLTSITWPDSFIPTFYHYKTNVFDGSWETYYTDYGLFIVTSAAAVHMATKIYQRHGGWSDSVAYIHWSTLNLMLMYAISVLLGGIAHQFLAHHIHTAVFRYVWTLCVGAVTTAGMFQGIVGSELAYLATHSLHEQKKSDRLYSLYIIPKWIWGLWAITLGALVWFGLFSMHQPAGDIFVAGVTQAAPSIYIAYVFFSIKGTFILDVKQGEKRKHEEEEEGLSSRITSCSKYFFLITLTINAPLILIYPIVERNFPDLPLGVFYTGLHTVLFIAWTSQYFALNQICDELCDKPYMCSSARRVDTTQGVGTKKKQ